MRLLIVLLSAALTLLSEGLPHTESFKTLQKIRPYAIEMGVGVTEIYVFVDPMCPKSRDYITQIATSGKLLRTHKYFIFLQRLEKFDSDRLIGMIYAATDPKSMMLKVMIERCGPDALKGGRTDHARKAVAAVSEAAATFKMKRRPYLMIFKPGPPYCIVSEGAPDCLPPRTKP